LYVCHDGSRPMVCHRRTSHD